ncbi:efflux RND transporter periplasmic adaptor subunit [Salinarimonas rosea]|uniref:efflux RND transporter periplasmic adaptor subunit n=1 Tax=Salinarimonas rosea TaxID=552063 RepID=UPI000426FF05|nr:efflux RND transporter periplasmic adaptor subunit [Salinarimonas rosea]
MLRIPLPAPHAAALAAALAALMTAAPALAAPIAPVTVVETKAVYGTVEARQQAPARARIGGTLVERGVEEGDVVAAGERIGLVVDEKIALQRDALEARLRALQAELDNARTELGRAEELVSRGVSTQQRVDQLGTQVRVVENQLAAAEAERAVLDQQAAEGAVEAPIAGRVVAAPATPGSVVMPGETVVTIAGGGLFLRLSLPERHADLLEEGATVTIAADDGAREGVIAKLYPQIENGRVQADVEVADIGGFFVGARTLVEVPVGTRETLALPATAVETRGGVDFVTLAGPDGPREVVVLLGERLPDGAVEIVSGLRAGDEVVQ